MDKITEYRKLSAPDNTVTRNVMDLCKDTHNIYETAVIVATRANEISSELKKELAEKLAAFAYYTDSPEREVFENEEQIELSRMYEKVPKAVLLSMQEFLDGRIQFSHASDDSSVSTDTIS